MMTEPGQQTRQGEASDADRRFREASQQPRGDWGNLGFVILDDENDEEGTDDAGR